MVDIGTLILIILGAPPAIQGLVDIAGRVRIIFDDSRKLKMLQKNPIGPGEQKFYVKSTYAKYILGEEATELTKVREIRVLEDVDQIKIDRVPAPGIPKPDAAATEPFQFEQDCFAMPGVALRRGAYYQVVLGNDQIFKANTDQTYVINIKVRAKLDVLHENPDEDGIQIQRPFGTEKLVAEVHFPPTHRLKKLENKVQLALYEVRGTDLQKIDAKKFKIDADYTTIQPILGTVTDMFRLTLPHPPQDADIRIMWQWSLVGAPNAVSIPKWRPDTIFSRQSSRTSSLRSTEIVKTGAGTARPLKVFISYSHKEKDMLEEFCEHLSPLVFIGLIQIWKDREIYAGDNWEGAIDEQIAAADIILLLVSKSFLGSNYCQKELKRAIEQHHAGRSVTVPIILKSCDWESVFNQPGYQLQALPRDNNPVEGGDWDNRDVAYTAIVKELRAKFAKMRSKL